ncbi:hypothetical protein J14TS5_34890 [Paenibacillus lautus]|nr:MULTISPECIES: hypothetical protein [Paenibacillus]GIO98403.1 hypothetical protein J14TS5_34890 [Paenibacillus lautus]
MDKIMTVSLAFDHKEEGTIIVGTNPEKRTHFARGALTPLSEPVSFSVQ